VAVTADNSAVITCRSASATSQIICRVKGRARVVGIFPNDASITRLVGAVLLEQDENWQLEGRRMFTADSMAAIPALEALPALQDAWNKSPHSGPRGSW
jgi:transposase-like protein